MSYNLAHAEDIDQCVPVCCENICIVLPNVYLILKSYCMEFGNTSMGQGDDEIAKYCIFNDFSTNIKVRDYIIIYCNIIMTLVKPNHDCTECYDLFGNKDSTIDPDIDIQYL